MNRGKEGKIIITRDEDSKKPKITVEGFWSGKERMIVRRLLPREMRRQAHKYTQNLKQAVTKEKKVDPIEEKRLAGLKKYWAAKKLKKEEEKKNDRGQ